jgi:hypothetical protein
MLTRVLRTVRLDTIDRRSRVGVALKRVQEDLTAQLGAEEVTPALQRPAGSRVGVDRGHPRLGAAWRPLHFGRRPSGVAASTGRVLGDRRCDRGGAPRSGEGSASRLRAAPVSRRRFDTALGHGSRTKKVHTAVHSPEPQAGCGLRGDHVLSRHTLATGTVATRADGPAGYRENTGAPSICLRWARAHDRDRKSWPGTVDRIARVTRVTM